MLCGPSKEWTKDSEYREAYADFDFQYLRGFLGEIHGLTIIAVMDLERYFGL